MPASRSSWLRSAWGIAAKDLAIEWHSREIVYTMGFLATLVVLIFSFALVAGQDSRMEPGTIAGILWVAVLFSGTVALSRTFDREREGEAIRSLLLSPVPRSAVYAGKLAATACIMFLVELVVTPLVGVFFSAPVADHAAWLALQLLLGTVGFSAAGVVFSAALLRSRSRDALLGALLFPVVVPVLMAGARGTTVLLDVDVPSLDPAAFWTRLLVAVDVIFVAVGIWAFEPVAMGD